MHQVRIGVVGLGWMGCHHAENILANTRAELAALCDADAVATTHFAQEHRCDCATYTDYAALLKADVDAVLIAAPNALHAEMCIAAARAGKHIYCEKPMAITLDDCRRVRDAVAKSGVKYLIGYHRRLNPLYQHARQLRDQGKLGRVFLAESDYIHHVSGDWDIWSWLGKEKVAGSLFHAGSGHNVDLLRYFCGDVTEVVCMKDIFLPRAEQVETEDTALALLRFESGAIGKVHCCVGPISPFQFNLRLYGTRGTVINNRVWLDIVPGFADGGAPAEELPSSWIPDNVQGGVSETWGKLLDHFVEVLLDDAPCINNVHSAYKTSVACFAAVASAQRGAVVAIKEME